MKRSKLLPLFLTQSFRSVAVTFLGFFSSVYIYKQTHSLLAVALFYSLLYLTKMMAVCLAEDWSQKAGLKRQVGLGHWLTVLTLVAFWLSQNNLAMIWWAAALWGLAIGFFWFGRFGLMLKIGQPGRFGKTLGWAGILETFLLLGVPFLGGLVINRWGYSALFLTALAFVFLALLVLRRVSSRKTHQDVHLFELWRLFGNHKRMVLAYFSSGCRGTLYATALILYIFLVLQGELAFGLFFSLALLVVSLANFVTGSWVDRKGKKELIAYGSVISTLVWLGRFLTATAGVLFVLDVIDRISGGMLGIPLEVLTYEKALDGRSTGRALLFREAAITSGSIFACLLLAVVVSLGWPLKTTFLVAGAFNLLPLLSLKWLK